MFLENFNLLIGIDKVKQVKSLFPAPFFPSPPSTPGAFRAVNKSETETSCYRDYNQTEEEQEKKRLKASRFDDKREAEWSFNNIRITPIVIFIK